MIPAPKVCTVDSIEQVRKGYPAVWHGTMTDWSEIEVRYRSGVFSVHINDALVHLVRLGESGVDSTVGQVDACNRMSTEEMWAHMPAWIKPYVKPKDNSLVEDPFIGGTTYTRPGRA